MAQPAQKESQTTALEKAARLPYHPGIKERFGVDAGAWRTLVEAIFPAAKTADAVLLALDYCKARNLDPFKRPVHIVPMWSQTARNGEGGYVETVWPGIWEMRATAFRTRQYAGMDEPDFGPMQTRDFKGVLDTWERGRKTGTKEISATLTFPEWCRCTVYRDLGGRLCKFVGPKVYWMESYATVGKTDVPNDMWRERPSGQIEKCAESGALRRAFPEELGNELSADEMSGRVIDADVPVAVASSAQETKAIMSPPPIPPEVPVVKPEAPVVKVVPPAETRTAPPEVPELPPFLDRRLNAPGPSQPGESSEPTPEPGQFDSDGALRAIQEACDNASSENEVDEIERMFAADLDAMSRNQRQIGEAAIGEAYERLRKATPPAGPPSDPFAVPPSFRDAAHVSEWVETMVRETKSHADALRLREAFNISKAERARFLGGPEYDRLVMMVKTTWLAWQPKDNPSPEGPPPIPPAKADDGIPKTWTEYCEKTREVMRNATTTREIQVDWLLKTVELRQRLWPSLQAYEDGLKREIRTRLDELYGR